MKKFTASLLFFLILSATLFAQSYKYAWLSDIHIGAPGADEDLQVVIDNINNKEFLDFVVATGDISEKGKDDELSEAKDLLDRLKIPYYIIPGNHDTKWSESGTTMFGYLWGDDKFVFEHEGTKHIGLNSGIPWRGGGGHIAREDLEWLDKVLEETPHNQEIILYAHHPLDGDIDNWFEVTNRLTYYNVVAVLVGHGHANKLMNFNGIPAAMGRSTLSRPKYAGYTIVENRPDSLLFYEVDEKDKPNLWGIIEKNKNEIPVVDSTQFEVYSDDVKIEWSENLNTTMSASLEVSDDRIFAATKNGMVFCYGLDGKLLWQYDTGGTIFSKPARDRDVLAIATIEGDLISLNSNNGNVLQIIGLGEPLTSQLIRIDFTQGEMKTTGVVVGTAYGNLYCYNLYTFEMLWENHSATGMIETTPLAIENKIIFGSWDNYLYCVNAETGSLIWKWTENKNFYYSPAAASPQSDGSHIFITTPDKYVSSIDLLLGTTVWHKDDFESWESIGISEDGKRIFIKSIEDKFYIISSKDGKLIKELDMDFGLDTMPVEPLEWKNNILFGGKNGMVYLIKKNYEWEPLFFTGTVRVHTIRHVKNSLFVVSNMDGKIFMFTLDL